MTGFDTVLIVDWSAGKRAPTRPSKDSIWMGIARQSGEEQIYCRSRQEAETRIQDLIEGEIKAGRRILAGFDFPFGYPAGVARQITGSDDPFALWHWLEARINDEADGSNNRFAVAEEMNACFDQLGPFWGKTASDQWPGVPYRKSGIPFDSIAERRLCDTVAKAASSCFQLAFPPTVGSQILMGLPTLARLRRRAGVVVWPFEDVGNASCVLAEIWPGLIEPAVRARLADLGEGAIRDREQVSLLARALLQMPAAELRSLMVDLPAAAKEEAWILGAETPERLSALTGPGDAPLVPPPLRNDCFALPAGVDWTPVEDALQLLSQRLTPVTAPETLPISQTLGRILTGDVRAARSNPPNANTAVDGYGFAGGVGDGPHERLLIKGRAAAGLAFDGAVPPGHAIRILTGAALPEGVDTVILEEDVNRKGDRIAFHGPLKTGANARKAGEDVRAGDVALSEGRVLTPADLALLAAVGVSDVSVRRPLRVGVLSTGDELVEPGETAQPGQIFDANRPMLLSIIGRFGHIAVDLGRVRDDRIALSDQLDRAAAACDAILTSGGASAGDEDHVSALLRERGAMQEWRIAVKPGRPLALGMWQDTPVFGLPGNPVAAMVCTLIFARPALSLLAGAGWQEPQSFLLPAAFEKNKKPGRREYLRARVRNGQAEVFKSEGSGRISGLSWAEGLVELDDGARLIRPGDPVRFLPYGSFGL